MKKKQYQYWLVSTIIIMMTLLLVAPGCAESAVSGNALLTQAANSLAAATGVAQQTADVVNATADAQGVIVRQTREAREQWEFEIEQTAVYDQMTKTAEANAIATAVAEATATAEANARATSTAVAQAADTATAEANATATRISGNSETATAAPLQTRTAQELEKEEAEKEIQLARLKWEKIATPSIYIAQLSVWGILILLGIWTLVWGIPRAYNLLALKVSSHEGESGDKTVFFFPMVGAGTEGLPFMKSLMAIWMDAPRLLSYDQDRDSGPGQVIDGTTGLLPGGDPVVTMRDQSTDLVVRSAMAMGRKPSRQAMQQLTQGPRYRILPLASPPPRQFVNQQIADILDAEWVVEEDR